MSSSVIALEIYFGGDRTNWSAATENQSETDDSSPSLTTIFVVEDEADLGLLLLRFLEEEVPCRVVLATGGFEVLKLVRSITP